MADFTETEYDLLTQQEHTHSVTDTGIIGAEQDVQTQLSGTIYFYHANLEVTPNATGVEYVLQGRPNLGGAADHKQWSDLITFQSGTIAAVLAQIAVAGEAQGQTVLSVKANPTGSFLRGIRVYMHDVSLATNGEWHTLDHSTTGPDTVVTLDGIGVALVEDDELWTQAELFSSWLPLDGIAYVRALVKHTAATGSDIALQAVLRAVTDIE